MQRILNTSISVKINQSALSGDIALPLTETHVINYKTMLGLSTGTDLDDLE